MRMRDQLVVIIAVAVATIAVAGNVFAQTHAANLRVAMEHEGLEVAWSYPVMDASTSTVPASPDEDGDDRSDRPAASTASADSPAACTDEDPCTVEDVLEREFRNHGQMVSSHIYFLGFAEGWDGPRGSYVREIAKPNIEEDGPPRADRAEENKDKDTPPGQDKKDTPPGQDKKDKDE